MAAAPVRGDDEPPVARVQLRVSPGADRTRVVGRHGDGWKLRVDAAPERGRANDRLASFLARLAGVRVNDVTVVAGASGRDKLVEVRGIAAVDLARMLDAAAGK